MSNHDSEWEANETVVEAARIVLRGAAESLTPGIEPAAIYSIAPHTLREDIAAGDDE